MQKTVVRVMVLLLVVLMCLTLLPIRSWAYDGDPLTCTHSFDEENINTVGALKTPASCTAAAVYYKTCSLCGAASNRDEDTFVYGEPLGHDLGEWTNTATCTAPGTKTRGCSRCEYTETEASDALGHDWGEYSADSATCTAGGQRTRSCQREDCSATDTMDTPALGHSWGDWTVTTPATCTTAGEKSHSCQREDCTASETETIDALGHDWGEYSADSATCTAGGQRTRSCQREDCSATDTMDTPALGHSWGDWIETTPATCTTAGEETQTCSRCGSTHRRTISALGHNFVGNVCENEGCNAKRASVAVTITGSGNAKIGGATVSSGQEVIVAPGPVSVELTPASGNRIASVTVGGTTITSPASPITVTAEEGEPCVLVSATFAASAQSGTSNPTASNPTVIVAPTAKADRTAPAVYPYDFLDDAGGAITGTTTEMLYREKGSSTFAPCKAGSTPVLHPGTYYVHYPEGETTKASAETEVVISSYYTVTAKHLYGKGTYYTDRPKLSGYENVFVVPSGETISFTFNPSGGYWIHEINKNGRYVGYENVKKNYTTKIIDKTVVSFGFSSSSSSPKTADPNDDIMKWGIAELVSLIGMTTITWYLFRKKDY